MTHNPEVWLCRAVAANSRVLLHVIASSADEPALAMNQKLATEDNAIFFLPVLRFRGRGHGAVQLLVSKCRVSRTEPETNPRLDHTVQTCAHGSAIPITAMFHHNSLYVRPGLVWPAQDETTCATCPRLDGNGEVRGKVRGFPHAFLSFD